jgi:hypothetical protein
LVSDIPAEEGKIANLFYSVKVVHTQEVLDLKIKFKSGSDEK